MTATGTDGKTIPRDRLAELLKDESVVVVTYGAPAAERYRKVFKDGTVFLTFPPPPAPAPVGLSGPDSRKFEP